MFSLFSGRELCEDCLRPVCASQKLNYSRNALKIPSKYPPYPEHLSWGQIPPPPVPLTWGPQEESQGMHRATLRSWGFCEQRVQHPAVRFGQVFPHVLVKKQQPQKNPSNSQTNRNLRCSPRGTQVPVERGCRQVGAGAGIAIRTTWMSGNLPGIWIPRAGQ